MGLKKSELSKLSIYVWRVETERKKSKRISSHENSKTIQVLTRHGSNFLPRDSLFDSSSNDLKTTDDASSYDSF